MVAKSIYPCFKVCDESTPVTCTDVFNSLKKQTDSNLASSLFLITSYVARAKLGQISMEKLRAMIEMVMRLYTFFSHLDEA